MERVISLCGFFAMLVLAWLMSSHKRRIPWRVVIGGTCMQFGFAVLILKTKAGEKAFAGIGEFFRLLLGFVDAGSSFVFGKGFGEHYVAFKVLPTIIFFSSFMSVLYYFGVMQWIVKGMAWLMQRTLGTSAAETLSASANVFMGQTEAPLVVRPFIGRMTLSELNAVMIGGFATIAGGVLAAYVGMGVDPAHLVTASVISAPAGLLVAKLMLPETQHPETLGHVAVAAPSDAVNVIDAAAIGASEGVKLAINVAAMLIAFLALIALVDAAVGWLGVSLAWVAVKLGLADAGLQLHWSLSAGLGYLFAPMAWIMGIESGECVRAGELLGIKMVANEFVAYERMTEWFKPESGIALSRRTIVILTYALCGFSNFGSIGIQLGGLSTMAPDRRGDLARLGLRAMLGGTLACNMTACVAGVIL